ncbi:hypothetical protein LK494_03070 [Anaerovorax odorimutans]|nr:hypothetical protein [Anaerovorax odorimutans]
MAYDMKYEIKQRFGILSKNKSGWKKELTLTSWNNNPAKLEIRDWNEDYTKCGKGLTLTDEEAVTLKALLNDLNI